MAVAPAAVAISPPSSVMLPRWKVCPVVPSVVSLPPARIVTTVEVLTPVKQLTATPVIVTVPPFLISMPDVRPRPEPALFVPPVIVNDWEIATVPVAEKSPRSAAVPVPENRKAPAPRSVLPEALVVLPLETEAPKVWLAELAKSKVAPDATVIAPT